MVLNLRSKCPLQLASKGFSPSHDLLNSGLSAVSTSSFLSTGHSSFPSSPQHTPFLTLPGQENPCLSFSQILVGTLQAFSFWVPLLHMTIHMTPTFWNLNILLLCRRVYSSSSHIPVNKASASLGGILMCH